MTNVLQRYGIYQPQDETTRRLEAAGYSLKPFWFQFASGAPASAEVCGTAHTGATCPYPFAHDWLSS